MSERKSLSGGDWLAVGTFLFGTLVAVLMAYGMLSGAGGEAGTSALAAAIAAAIGPWPALIGGAGIALLGARAFLTSEREGLGTGILGVVGIAIGLCVVAGSLSPSRGGSLGAGSGGRIGEMTHPAVGLLLGAIVAFGAAYFAWMREDPAAAAKLAPARRLTPAPPKSDDGVTAAESAMLFPVDAAKAASERAKAPAPTVMPKPLYPEDVRQKGEVPSGAAPLSTPSARVVAPAVPETPEPAVYRWTAPRATAAEPQHISHEEIEALADVAPPMPAPSAAPIPQRIAARTAANAPVVAPIVAANLDAELDEEPVVSPLPPAPSWESTGLAADDEPVDAYGTPLSLVERARLDRVEPAIEEAARVELVAEDLDADDTDDAELDLEEDDTDEDELEPIAGTRIPREIGAEDEDAFEGDEDDEEAAEEAAEDEEPEVVVTAVEVVEIRAFVAEPGETEVASDSVEEARELVALFDELRAHNAATRAEVAATVDEEGYDALEAELDEEEEPVLAAEATDADEESDDEEITDDEVEAAADELDEEDVDEVDVPEQELVAETLVEVTAVLELGPDLVAEVAAEPEPEPDAEAAAEAAAEEPAEEPEPEPAPKRSKAAAAAKNPPAPAPGGPSLFDAVETEPEVVLQPQAAVPASRAEKTPGRGIDPEKKLLVEVGCMFVERGRVAVSMLQRQYDMDFDQACRVLDDLQELGLIGPYMGGKNREILLTRDAWLEKVGVG